MPCHLIASSAYYPRLVSPCCRLQTIHSLFFCPAVTFTNWSTSSRTINTWSFSTARGADLGFSVRVLTLLPFSLILFAFHITHSSYDCLLSRLGWKGECAESFSELMKMYWGGKYVYFSAVFLTLILLRSVC